MARVACTGCGLTLDARRCREAIEAARDAPLGAREHTDHNKEEP
ncbi:hypothetical protein [Desulfocurvus sp.]|nr:hypothetical protein [Desulfocurvus sp.]